MARSNSTLMWTPGLIALVSVCGTIGLALIIMLTLFLLNVFPEWSTNERDASYAINPYRKNLGPFTLTKYALSAESGFSVDTDSPNYIHFASVDVSLTGEYIIESLIRYQPNIAYTARWTKRTNRASGSWDVTAMDTLPVGCEGLSDCASTGFATSYISNTEGRTLSTAKAPVLVMNKAFPENKIQYTKEPFTTVSTLLDDGKGVTNCRRDQAFEHISGKAQFYVLRDAGLESKDELGGYNLSRISVTSGTPVLGEDTLSNTLTLNTLINVMDISQYSLVLIERVNGVNSLLQYYRESVISPWTFVKRHPLTFEGENIFTIRSIHLLNRGLALLIVFIKPDGENTTYVRRLMYTKTPGSAFGPENGLYDKEYDTSAALDYVRIESCSETPFFFEAERATVGDVRSFKVYKLKSTELGIPDITDNTPENQTFTVAQDLSLSFDNVVEPYLLPGRAIGGAGASFHYTKWGKNYAALDLFFYIVEYDGVETASDITKAYSIHAYQAF